jgi:hypothetical protein
MSILLPGMSASPRKSGRQMCSGRLADVLLREQGKPYFG